MLLEVEEKVFESSDHPAVFTLFGLVADERHDWWLTMPAARAAEQFVEVNAPHTAAYAELVGKALEESAYPPPAHSSVSRRTVTAAELSQLVWDLSQQAVVVVEDHVNEGSFLRAAARAFGQERILRALEKSWLRVRHAGGKDQMIHIVTDERQSFRLCVRVAALLDSDRSVPGRRTENHKKADELRIIDGVTEVYVWAWRELENYVPTRVWHHQFPDRRRKIDMLLSMNHGQRGCLDIKKGMESSLTSNDPECAALYTTLPHEIRQTWRSGLASGRRRMPRPVIPRELELTAADFDELGPDTVAELKELLAMINRIL